MATALTITLDEFLLARIAEDEERVSQAIGATPWAVNPPNLFHHVALRHLGDCEAKRRLIDFALGSESWDGPSWPPPERFAAHHALNHGHPRVLALLALPYADHPDYREEWRR